MKRSVYILATAAVIALAACSKDETRKVNVGHAISFRTAMGTRVAEINNSNAESTLSSFWVSAVDENGNAYFKNVLFKRGEDGTYDSDYPVFWPSDGSKLTFYAYNYEAGDNVQLGSDAKKIAGYVADEITEGAQNQFDFITSGPVEADAATNSGVVQVTFKHRLAQIQIQAKSENPYYVFKVAGYRLGKFCKTADLNLAVDDNTSADLWSNPASKGMYQFTYETGKYNTLTSEYQNMMYYQEPAASESEETSDSAGSGTVGFLGDVAYNVGVIPQVLTPWDKSAENSAEGAYLSLNLRIETTTGRQIFPHTGDYGWAAIPLNQTFQAGNCYLLQLDLTNGAGNVDPETPTPEPGSGDPYNPGSSVMGSNIRLIVYSIQSWPYVYPDGTGPQWNEVDMNPNAQSSGSAN